MQSIDCSLSLFLSLSRVLQSSFPGHDEAIFVALIARQVCRVIKRPAFPRGFFLSPPPPPPPPPPSCVERRRILSRILFVCATREQCRWMGGERGALMCVCRVVYGKFAGEKEGSRKRALVLTLIMQRFSSGECALLSTQRRRCC